MKKEALQETFNWAIYKEKFIKKKKFMFYIFCKSQKNKKLVMSASIFYKCLDGIEFNCK